MATFTKYTVFFVFSFLPNAYIIHCSVKLLCSLAPIASICKCPHSFWQFPNYIYCIWTSHAETCAHKGFLMTKDGNNHKMFIIIRKKIQFYRWLKFHPREISLKESVSLPSFVNSFVPSFLIDSLILVLPDVLDDY